MTTGNQHNPLASKKRTFLGNFTFHKSNYDMVLLGIVAGLTICGLAFLASSLAPREAFDFHQQFLYQLIFGVWIGGVLMYILARTDYHKLLEHKRSFLIVSLVLLGFLGVIGGAATILGLNGLEKVKFVDQFENPIFAPFIANGSIRWITTPIIRIQASEIAKIGLLVYFAGHLHKLSNRKVDLPITWYDLKKPLYAFLVSAGLIIVQPDLGSIILIYIILFSAMFVSKVPAKIYATFTLGMMIFGLFFSLQGYRLARVKSVFTRNTDSSYQIDGVENAVKNGGLFGTGYGNSYAKQQGTILESTTDSIIGVIAEEMGFVVTILFCSMYLWLLFRGLKIAEQAPDAGGRALATGISVWIASQAFLNIGGNLGIVPLKGLPLPFVSEGGSAIVLNLMSIGILLNISAQGIKKTAEEKLRFTKMRFDKEVQGSKKVYRRRAIIKNNQD